MAGTPASSCRLWFIGRAAYGSFRKLKGIYLNVPLTGYYKGTIRVPFKRLYKELELPKMRGTLFWCPQNKDPKTCGIISGSPVFGNSHMVSTEARSTRF